MVSILLSESLSNHVNGAVKLTSSFKTLVEVIDYLKKTYPGLYKALINDKGEVKDDVAFYLNSQPVTEHLREPIPLHEKDCLEIVNISPL